MQGNKIHSKSKSCASRIKRTANAATITVMLYYIRVTGIFYIKVLISINLYVISYSQNKRELFYKLHRLVVSILLNFLSYSCIYQ